MPQTPLTQGRDRLTRKGWVALSIGVAVGVAVARALPDFGVRLGLVANSYQRLLQSLAVPAVFSAVLLVLGGRHGEGSERGASMSASRVWRTALLTMMVAAQAGLTTLVTTGSSTLPTRIALTSAVERVAPESVILAAAGGQLIQVLFWSAIFARALAQVRPSAHRTMLGLGTALADVIGRLSGFAEVLAPVGLGGAVAASIGRYLLGSEPGLQVVLMTMTLALLLVCRVLCREAGSAERGGDLES